LKLAFRLREKSVIFEKKYNMNLSQEEWASQLAADENALVLDVRTDEECAEGIIPNALMIDIYKGQGFIYQVDELDKSKNIYVYCKAGGRSAQACSIMNQLGFANTYNLMGGFMNWEGEVVLP
jgi:rhodanese-related sulfurtransferase